MKKWQLQNIKAKLIALVKQASRGKPEQTTAKERAEIVILPAKRYVDLTSSKISLVEFLRNSPLYGAELDLERNQTPCRDIEL
ncbi:MAG: type II toxin-antitoxin system prevent-host-death family antitoxin [Rickettsiales bacterium]|nr:MAG: type II toxin-antitoxin system prevent-host-death family antitoxin [Rickettsiales bacterium]